MSAEPPAEVPGEEAPAEPAGEEPPAGEAAPGGEGGRRRRLLSWNGRREKKVVRRTALEDKPVGLLSEEYLMVKVPSDARPGEMFQALSPVTGRWVTPWLARCDCWLRRCVGGCGQDIRLHRAGRDPRGPADPAAASVAPCAHHFSQAPSLGSGGQ